jgi:hypothetical protein
VSEEKAASSAATPIELLTIGEDCDWIVAEGHHDLVRFALRAYDYARIDLDLWDTDAAREAAEAAKHAYVRSATLGDFPEYADDPAEQASVYARALEEDYWFFTDEPTDRPVTMTGRLT